MNKIGKVFKTLGLIFLGLAICLFSYNILDDYQGQKSQSQILKEYSQKIKKKSNEIIMDSTLNMPEIPLTSYGNAACIGTLKIPSLNLELPVLSECTMSLLKLAPCRYAGSIDQNNMVIAAHNSWFHFGRIKQLQKGSQILFTDVNGNEFEYHVDVIEVLTPQSVDDMINTKWPLSLFTCTLDAKNRITVRCK